MIAARFSIFGAILAAMLMEAGVLGAHLGVLAPMTGLRAFVLGFVIAALALVLGVLGVVRTSAAARRSGRRYAAAGVVLGLLIVVPTGLTMWRWLSMPYPDINDITTDYANPPQFANRPGLSAASMRYDRARLESIQTRYYPKLGPLRLDERPDDAFARVRAAAHVPPLAGRQIANPIPSMPGWFIVYIDPATRTVEGVETSWLFRFRDDFVIEVRPGPDAGSSLVEMRSRSRHGIGDFGANYNRICAFFALLKRIGDSRAASGS